MTRIRTKLAGAMIGLACAATACSSPPSQDPSDVSSASTATTAPASRQAPSSNKPTTIPANPEPGAAPAVLHKQIGELASIGCPDDPVTPCDVDFRITSIESGVQCVDEYDEPLQSDEQLVRFDIEITTAPQFQNDPDVGTAFFLDNWGIGDNRGVSAGLDQRISLDCRSEQLQKILYPGQHITKSIVVTAPKTATTLRLYMDGTGAGWTWDVPPTPA